MAEIVDRKRIKELQDREEKRLEQQTPKSALLYQRAKESLVRALGVRLHSVICGRWSLYQAKKSSSSRTMSSR